MPVLESPEVFTAITASGLASFHQKVNTDLREAYETDVGLNDRAGLNVLCSSIHIYHPPVAGDFKTGVRMSVYLSEAWSQKDEFLTRLRDDHKIPVREEPIGWGCTLTHITVSGQDNIRALGKHLRESFAETCHEGATIQRQIVNAALLGTALDHMDDLVAKSQEPKQTDGPTWATMKWNAAPAADNYGWRP